MLRLVILFDSIRRIDPSTEIIVERATIRANQSSWDCLKTQLEANHRVYCQNLPTIRDA